MTTEPLILPSPYEVQRLRVQAGALRFTYLIALIRRWFGTGHGLPTGPAGTPGHLSS